MEISVVIESEVFSAATRDRVWRIESDISDQASVGVIVVDASDVVANQLRKDGLIPK